MFILFLNALTYDYIILHKYLNEFIAYSLMFLTFLNFFSFLFSFLSILIILYIYKHIMELT